MRVLIIGCGYVGLPLGAELARQGHEVFGLRRSAAAATALRNAGIKPVFADITRREDLPRLPTGFGWVIHCVASGGGDAEDYRRLYLEGTRNVLAWLASSPPEKFVYTSSTSVYGQEDGSLVDETSATKPVTETAQVLLETERLLLEAERQNGFPSIILRVAGIYGRDRGHWLKQFLTGQARLEGNGERHLNMIHCDDVIGCILSVLRNGRPGQVYNVVDDEPVSQFELFEWLAGKLGKPMPSSADESPQSLKRGLTDKRISNQKLKKELDYRFKYPTFRQGCGAELHQLAAGNPPGKSSR